MPHRPVTLPSIVTLAWTCTFMYGYGPHPLTVTTRPEAACATLMLPPLPVTVQPPPQNVDSTPPTNLGTPAGSTTMSVPSGAALTVTASPVARSPTATPVLALAEPSFMWCACTTAEDVFASQNSPRP